MGTNETREVGEQMIRALYMRRGWILPEQVSIDYMVEETYAPMAAVALAARPTVTVEQIAEELGKHLLHAGPWQCYCGAPLQRDGLEKHRAQAVLALFTNGDK